MSTKVGIWVRVSSASQDEKSQIPDILAYCEKMGYEVVEPYYQLHDKSGFKGEQAEKLQEVISDIEAGKISCLICWHSDRLDRRGPKAGYAFLYSVELAGGRVESVLDPEFGQDNFGAEVMTTVRMAHARDETRHKAEKSRIGLDAARENGAALNGPPWGLRITGPKRNKRFTATAEGRRIVPTIFLMIADQGMSLTQVTDWLRESRVPGKKWTIPGVRGMIMNPAYKGTVVNAEDNITHRFEALVDADLWERANKALSDKARKHQGPTVKAMLGGVLFCATCDSPMYRVHHERGDAQASYRCSGKPSCRMVPMMAVNAGAEKLLAKNILHRRIFTQKLKPGKNWNVEISETKFELRHLDPDAQDYDERHDALRSKLAELKSRPVVPDEWESTDTGRTYMDEYKQLRPGQHGAWLKRKGIRVMVASDEDMHISLKDIDLSK